MEPYQGSHSPGPLAAAHARAQCCRARACSDIISSMNESRENPSPEIITVFNLVAGGYDDAALRFFPFCADRVIARLNPPPGAKLLDVATGTGAIALAASQAVGPQGRIIAIDLAERMLDRFQAKIDKFGVANLDLHVMDAHSLEFRRDYFDYVV